MKFVSGMSHSSDSDSGHIENRRVSAYYFRYKIFETTDLRPSRPIVDVAESYLIFFKRLLGFKNGTVFFVGKEKSSSPEIYSSEHLLSLRIFRWIKFRKNLSCSRGISHI